MPDRRPKSDAEFAASVLRDAGGAHPPFLTRLRLRSPNLILVFLAVGVVGLSFNWLNFLPGDETEDKLRTIASVVTAFAFGIGLKQWYAARHESSLDKYYDRLNLANTRFDQAITSRHKSPADSAEARAHYYTMFVFSEIDNLEYIIEKHCLGYVNPSLVGRALKHFQQRCKDDEFRASVTEWVNRGGYSERTRRVAEHLVSKAEKVSNVVKPGNDDGGLPSAAEPSPQPHSIVRPASAGSCS